MNVQAKRIGKAGQQSMRALCREPVLTLGWCRTVFVTGQCLEAA